MTKHIDFSIFSVIVKHKNLYLNDRKNIMRSMINTTVNKKNGQYGNDIVLPLNRMQLSAMAQQILLIVTLAMAMAFNLSLVYGDGPCATGGGGGTSQNNECPGGGDGGGDDDCPECSDTPCPPGGNGSPMCGRGNPGVAVAGDPVMLGRGASYEYAVDLELPGPGLNWLHRRTYTSTYTLSYDVDDDEGTYTPQGVGWAGGWMNMYITKGDTDGDEFDDDVTVYFDATSHRGFVGDNGVYDSPGDYRAELIQLSNNDYQMTDFAQGLIYTFANAVPGVTQNSNGYIKSVEDLYGNKVEFSRGGQYINQATTSQGWVVDYTYTNFSGYQRLTTIEVKKVVTETPLQYDVIQKVNYTYFDSNRTEFDEDGAWEHLGSDGDLIMIEVLKKDSDDPVSDPDAVGGYDDTDFSIRRITQYRYKTVSATDPDHTSKTFDHLLEHVFSPGDIDRILSAGESGVEDPEDIFSKINTNTINGVALEDYASRTYEYYEENLDTTDVDTVWEDNENIESKYNMNNISTASDSVEHENAISEYNQHLGAGRIFNVPAVKKEIVRGRRTIEGEYYGSELTRQFYYMLVYWRPYIQADDVAWLIVEDTIDSANTGVKRTVFGLNYVGMKLREVTIDDPSASTPQYWGTAWLVDAGDGLDSNKLNRVKELRGPGAHNLDSASDVHSFLNPSYDIGSSCDSQSTACTIALPEGDWVVPDARIYLYEYDDQGRKTATKIKKGLSGTEYYLSATDYIDDDIATADGYDTSTKFSIIARKYSYSQPVEPEITTNGQGEVTYNSRYDADGVSYVSYKYTFWDDDGTGPSDDDGDNPTFGTIKTLETTYPVVSTSENGSGVATKTYEYYDSSGLKRWYKDGEGNVTYYSYHPDNGELAYVMEDVETDDLPAEIPDTAGNYSDKWIAWSETLPAAFANTDDGNLQLIKKYEYDDQGRMTKEEDAEGVATYYVYDAGSDFSDSDLTIVFPAWDSTSNESILPIRVKAANAYNQITETYTLKPSVVELTSGLPTGIPALGDTTNPLTQDDYLSYTRYLYNFYGYIEKMDRYFDIPSSTTHDIYDDTDIENGVSTYFNRTVYRYDKQGRKIRDIRVVSGATSTNRIEQVTGYVYNKSNKITEIKRGVSSTSHSMGSDYNTDPTNFKIITEFVYDDQSGSGCSSCNSPTNTLSSRIDYYNASDDTDKVVTYYIYDWRGRRRGIIPETGPYIVIDYHWDGGKKAIAHFAMEPTWTTVLSNEDYAKNASDTSRRYLKTMKYDVLGRLYEISRSAVNNNGLPGNQLVDKYYYDKNGRIVASQAPGGGLIEYANNSIGKVYQTRNVATSSVPTYDANGDYNYSAPSPEPILSDMADYGGNENIVSIIHHEFNKVGHIIKEIHVSANHDQTDGLLMTIGSEDYVKTFKYSWYDKAHRLTATADYGTNTTGWTVGGSSPAYSGIAPERSDNILVASYVYDAVNGYVTVKDPKGIETRTISDALGRKRYIVENFNDFDESDESDIGGTNGDEDRVTEYEYNSLNMVTNRIVHWVVDSSDETQTTQYLYGDNYNAALVTNIIYPDSTDTDTSGSDQAVMTYDLDGRVSTRTDQRGVTITYEYDDLARRLEKQRFSNTTVPSSVDTTIRSIVRSYDTMGRVSKISSYSQPDPTIGTDDPVNEIVYAYDDLGRVVTEYQEHEGVKDVNTLSISYTYDSTTHEYGDYDILTNGNRLAKVTYPNDRDVHYLYTDSGDTSGIADKLSRGTAIATATTRGTSDANVLAAYSHTGNGRLVVEDFVQPDVKLDYYGDTAGTYAGFDRFGRVTDQRWIDYGGVPDIDRDRFKYGYDRNSNREFRELASAGAPTGASSSLDYQWQYDNLDRLVKSHRGELDGNDAVTDANANHREHWSLDMLGNWESYQVDGNGTTVAADGDIFRDPTDLDQIRYHYEDTSYRSANEINRDGSNDPITEYTNQTMWATPVYDAAGNMTTAPQPRNLNYSYTLVYDAWNRLAQVKNGAVVIAKYEYDGLNRVAKKHYDSDYQSNPDGVDTYRHYYYNQNWQVLESREVYTSENDAPDSTQPMYQYVWSMRYIDAPILRDKNTDTDDLCDDQRLYYLTDANMNVTTLVNTTGDAVERYGYNAYGSGFIYSGDWSSYRTNSIYSNAIRFSGYRYEHESGLYHIRYRYFHAEMGRWMQQDPIGYVGGFNLYEYVYGKPTVRVDTLGLDEAIPYPEPRDPMVFPPPSNFPPTTPNPPIPPIPPIPPVNPQCKECPDGSEPNKSNEECCADAWRTVHKPNTAAIVVCCNGAKIGCVRSDYNNPSSSDIAGQIIKDCTLAHEKEHFPQTEPCSSDPCAPPSRPSFRPDRDWEADECKAHFNSFMCGINKRSSCKSAIDPDACLKKLNSYISSQMDVLMKKGCPQLNEAFPVW